MSHKVVHIRYTTTATLDLKQNVWGLQFDDDNATAKFTVDYKKTNRVFSNGSCESNLMISKCQSEEDERNA